MKKLREIELRELVSDREILLDENEDDVGPSFALCSATRKQATEFHSCREGLISEIFDSFKKSPYRKNRGRVDTKKMRLLALIPWPDDLNYVRLDGEYDKALLEARNSIDDEMRTGLKIINHFEKMAKWPKTELCRASYRHLPSSIFMYLFIGSARWMRSPHMISLFVLLARLGRISDFKDFRSHEQFLEICKKLISDNDYDDDYGYFRGRYDEDIAQDVDHLKTIYDKVEIVMKHFNYLFGKRTPMYSFTKAIANKLRYGEGISRLCSKASGDKAVAVKFEKLRKKYGR